MNSRYQVTSYSSNEHPVLNYLHYKNYIMFETYETLAIILVSSKLASKFVNKITLTLTIKPYQIN